MPLKPSLMDLIAPFFGFDFGTLPMPGNDPMELAPGLRIEPPFFDPRRFGSPQREGGGRLPEVALPDSPFTPGPVPEPFDGIDLPPETLPPGPGMDGGPDMGNPFSWEPAGFRMNSPGASAAQGLGGGMPYNDNAGAMDPWRIRPPRPGNDNTPQKTAYSPMQEALIEQGLPPNGPQAEGFAQLSPGVPQGAKPAAPASAPAPQDPKRQFISKVFGAESGGNPRAKNPRSSALGLGQYLKGTWASMMRRHPELGLTVDGRTDPTQNRKAIWVSAGEYEAKLRAAGLPVTAGTLYGAHFLGEAGIVQALRNPDSASMPSVVGPGVIRDNPFLARMNVGQFRQWLDRKMSGKASDVGTSPIGEAASAAGPAATAGAAGAVVSAPGNFKPDLPDSPQGRKGGAPGFEMQEQGSVTQPTQGDPTEVFLPYLQELARRREVYRQRSADRRSRVEELLQLGDRRSTSRA